MKKKACSHCKQEKEHRRVIKPKTGKIVYKDETNRQWKCDTCPECLITKQTKLNKMNNNVFGKTTTKSRHRLCGICKKELPLDRYFNHQECVDRIHGSYHDIFSEYEFHVQSK
jgi:uncharacterized CHY-type Zn-finger protein